MQSHFNDIVLIPFLADNATQSIVCHESPARAITCMPCILVGAGGQMCSAKAGLDNASLDVPTLGAIALLNGTNFL